MDDVISRQQAIDEIKEIYEWHDNVTKERIIEHFERLPSAQPEIIRCKDCKHWLDIDDGRQKHRMCADIYGDWFCADAERRTDE